MVIHLLLYSALDCIGEPHLGHFADQQPLLRQ